MSHIYNGSEIAGANLIESLLRWHVYYLDIARLCAMKSKDPSTKVGAVLVQYDWSSNSPMREFLGYNGFPRRIKDTPERLANRELRLALTLHAEENALIKAGRDAEGGVMYVWCDPQWDAPCTCAGCAIRQAQYRTRMLVSWRGNTPDRWKESQKLSHQILQEAGIDYYGIDICLISQN
jgi:dCMP deaminase